MFKKVRCWALAGVAIVGVAAIPFFSSRKVSSSPIPVERPDVTVVGFVNMADGIGRQSAELIAALSPEFSVNFSSTQYSVFNGVAEEVARIVQEPLRAPGRVIIFEEMMGVDPQKVLRQIPIHEEQIRIAYSMIEGSRIPLDWVDIFNQWFDLVVVPDPFLIEVYQSSGVRIPIFCIPLALDLSRAKEAAPREKKQGSRFRVLVAGACSARKNIVTIVQAFHIAFQNDPSKELLIHYRVADPEAIRDVVKTIHDLGVTNVRFSSESLPSDRYIALLQSADVLINLSKGEGYSIQPREAAVLGIPSIISTNTAHITMLATHLFEGVPAGESEPAYNVALHRFCGTHRKTDPIEAAKVLKRVVEEGVPQERLRAAREYVLKACAMEDAWIPYKVLVRPREVRLAEQDRVLPAEGVLETTSLELVRAYQRVLGVSVN